MARSSDRTNVSRFARRAPPPKRLLRAEFLEPRLVLSTTVALQPPLAAPLPIRTATAQAISLSPIADASVRGTNPSTNYGNATDLLIQNDSRFSTTDDAEAYLKFDMTGITSPVSKAVLTLTPLSTGSAVSSLTIGVGLLRDSNDGWIEGTGGINRSRSGPITWNNSPYAYGSEVSVSGSKLAALTPISIDVTQLVNQKFNTNQIASFIIEPLSRAGASQWVDFASREYANAALRPVLVVTPSGPVTPAPTVTQPVASNRTATSVQLSASGSQANNDPLTYTWSATSSSGAPAPVFTNSVTTNGTNTVTANFSRAGTYSIVVTVKDTTTGLSVNSAPITVTVGQALSKITVSPASVTLAAGTTQVFAAQGIDQFGQVMNISSATTVTWTASTGSFGGNATATGNSVTYTAAGTATTDVVTASIIAADGTTVQASATVTVVKSGFLGLKDPVLAALVQTLDADNSISRSDMLSIFNTVEGQNGGVLSATDFSDLKTILANAAAVNMPGYVQVLAGDVINGNVANAHYQGAVLGNLAVGSSSTVLQELVGKWFLGTDLPATGGYQYDASTSGVLFGSAGPSHLDEHQGYLGDCYLISSLGTIADASQSLPVQQNAIRNMFIDNGDDTWTVRFFTSSGRADYVTINSRLPVSGGSLIFDGMGQNPSNPSNVLWIALAEKAYAQWNETGNEGRDGKNSYPSIEGGWMADVDAQVLGHPAPTYNMDSTGQQAVVKAFTTAGKSYAVTIGTRNFNYDSSTGLYGDHAYAIIGYNASSGTFTLYNPWGTSQPKANLTWSQLVSTCDGIVIADPSGTSPISASQTGSSVIHPLVIAGLPGSPTPVAPIGTRAVIGISAFMDPASSAPIQNVMHPAATTDTASARFNTTLADRASSLDHNAQAADALFHLWGTEPLQSSNSLAVLSDETWGELAVPGDEL